MVQFFNYKGSRHITNPKDKVRDNIIGLELEFNNCTELDCDNCYGDCDYCDEEGEVRLSEQVRFALERLVDKGVLITPENTEMISKHNAVLERDSSVDGEIIIQADLQRNMMKKVNKIHEELNSNVLSNGPNTSCHIHRNVAYLNDIGISKFDYQKSSEFLSTICYRISGRDYDSYYQWAHSIFRNQMNIERSSMFKIAKLLDNIDFMVNDQKYIICNCQHTNTVENRIFSNFHNYDPKYIKLYMDFTNLAIDIAEYMRDKSYVLEFDTLIDIINDFCNKRQSRKRILRQFNLEEYIVKKEDTRVIDFNDKWTSIYDQMENVLNQYYASYNHKIMNIIRLTRNFNLDIDTEFVINGEQQNNRIHDEILKSLNRQYNEEFKLL